MKEQIKKQAIEEIASFIVTGKAHRIPGVEIAKAIFNAGYRKQSEGEWIVQGLANPKCSVCKHYGYYKDNFCPNCGAKMKGGE